MSDKDVTESPVEASVEAHPYPAGARRPRGEPSAADRWRSYARTQAESRTGFPGQSTCNSPGYG